MDIGSIGLDNFTFVYKLIPIFSLLLNAPTLSHSLFSACPMNLSRDSIPKFYPSPLHAFICPSSPAVNTVLYCSYISYAIVPIYNRIRTESKKQKVLTISDP